MTTYLKATRHPWVCLLFLAPLLAVYEGGVLWLAGDKAATLRNGADAWLRWQLDTFGVGHVLAAPAVVVVVFTLWSWWRWADRPDDPLTAWFGTVFESGLFAFLLWQVSRNFGPILDHLGVKLDVTAGSVPAGQILTYIGAGIYEEVLFRLGLFGGLCLVIRAAGLPKAVAVVLAAAGAAFLFSAAHHLTGEPVRAYVFLFRAVAGLFFTALFVGRGFGVAVGAHAGYDVLVGVAIQ